MAGAGGHFGQGQGRGGGGGSEGRGGGGSWRGAPPPGLERGSNKQHNRKSNHAAHQKQGATGGGGANQNSGSSNIPVDGMTSRLRFMAMVLVGHKVQVQVKSGVIYEGILHTMKSDTAKDFDVVLLMAEKKAQTTPTATGEKQDNAKAMSEVVERPVPKLVIHSQDVVQMTAKSVRTDAAAVGVVSHGSREEDAGGFGTDASISRGKATGYGRQLQKWTPDEEDMSISGNGGPQGGPVVGGAAAAAAAATAGVSFAYQGDGAKNWDQFAAFERMTGAKTTYKEETYTTALNKNDPRMKALEAQAERIAREIEGQSSSNVHVAEERGHYIDDSGMDEEDKYSGVIRSSNPPSTMAKDGEKKTFSSHAVPTAGGKKAGAAGGAEGEKDSKKKDQASAGASASTKPKSTGLNPNAKPFSFNANAKEFVPGRKSAAAAGGGGFAQRPSFGGQGGGYGQQQQMMGSYGMPQMNNPGMVNPNMQTPGFVSPMYRPNQYGGGSPMMYNQNNQMYGGGQQQGMQYMQGGVPMVMPGYQQQQQRRDQ